MEITEGCFMDKFLIQSYWNRHHVEHQVDDSVDILRI